MKLNSSAAWLAAVATMAGGLVYASDYSPPPCTVVVSVQQTGAEAPASTEEETRTESVTLLVRGMMKSRSGAT